jgi:4-aminobutyrate aminotransferase-like enzyme
MYDQASCGSLAVCLVECVQGDGGIHVLPLGYLQALKEHCERRGALLIVDEAQTGLGRTGKLFAFQDHGVVPDILTLSKPLANGLPLSAVVTSAKINSAAKENGFLFFTTHANDPLVAAVGNKVLEIVLRDDLATNAKQRGEQLLRGLRRLQDEYPFIGDVRGRGLMVGVEIVVGAGCRDHDPELAARLSILMLKSGLWCQLQSKAVFRIGPPINCTPEEIEQGLRILEEVFSSV